MAFRVAWLGAFLLLAAFVLLLLCSLSVPIIKSIYYLKLADSRTISFSVLSTTQSYEAEIGAWGACVDTTVTARDCTEHHVGWNLGDFDIPGVSDSTNSIIHGLTYALVITPVATALTFVALVLALTTHRIGHVLASIVAFLAALVAMLALILDLALFVTARNRLNNILPGEPASLGNALWLTLVAFLLLLIASYTVCFGGSRDRRRHADRERVAFEHEKAAVGSRRRFTFFRRH